ncbi:hypothetical protein BV25DRAFT_1973739 [Artomyces pyxidatus]|uniref:Uncharacterized protein n=1 Tax=Artomyces pyxidatus TaxID=48021 RepID=A0ACB8SN63_9AGAM|nr:hypothetical protein BV25DRAFT_1973739 [Artomyces pyxidatus]
MRYGVPRSPSPSKARSQVRRRRSSTFGLQSDSSSEGENEYRESGGSDSEIKGKAKGDAVPSSDSDSDSFIYDTEADVPPSAPRRSRRSTLTPAEQNYVEDTLAAIQLRTRYQDPYEDWQKQIRKDAFNNARRELSAIRRQNLATHVEARARDIQLHRQRVAQEVKTLSEELEKLNAKFGPPRESLLARRANMNQAMNTRVREVVQAEEAKEQARLAQERAAREQAERQAREAEERARREAKERADAEERKRKEQEEKRLAKEREEEEKKKLEQVRQSRDEKLQKVAEGRKAAGMTTPEEDWAEARESLKHLKAGPMRNVKGNPALKKLWNENRRKIIPRVGQLTNDPKAITNISQQILEVLKPSQPLPDDVYFALLVSLSKTILLQAETEVTAEKRSAFPLASMTANLMTVVTGFDRIFWTKLVQRTGGWAVPASPPAKDFDGTPFDEAQLPKVRGQLPGESPTERTARIAGIMRVYFTILHLPVSQPLWRPFQLPRFWAYFARTVSQPALRNQALAPELLAVALDVGGLHAKHVWGLQWVKMMAMLYSAVTTEAGPSRGGQKLMGGTSSEAKATQIRLQLEIERVMNTPS